MFLQVDSHIEKEAKSSSFSFMKNKHNKQIISIYYTNYGIQWEISEPLAGRIIKPETTIPVPIFGIPIFRIR